MEPENRSPEVIPEYIEDLPLGEIIRAVKSVRYGYVQIVIQDSRVVQIDRTEKRRLTRDSGPRIAAKSE